MPSSRASTARACAHRSRPICPPRRPRPSAARLTPQAIDPAALTRFGADLDALIGPDPIGLAVSGGADSVALLLLAAAARPGAVAAISVDHGLRPEAAGEVASVAALCGRLGVPHHAVRLSLDDGPDLQGRARDARYAAMARIADAKGLMAVATAHHADDQAETLLMRLGRGAGVSGLAGIRPRQVIGGLTLLRPLLGWRKAELTALCTGAGIEWAEDPSNADPRFTRARTRAALAGLDLDSAAIGRSAAALESADRALDWAADQVADRLRRDGTAWALDATGLPAELVRRLLARAVASLGAQAPRGPDLARAIEALRAGRKASLSGLLLEPVGPDCWRIAHEPPRRG